MGGPKIESNWAFMSCVSLSQSTVLFFQVSIFDSQSQIRKNTSSDELLSFIPL